MSDDEREHLVAEAVAAACSDASVSRLRCVFRVTDSAPRSRALSPPRVVVCFPQSYAAFAVVLVWRSRAYALNGTARTLANDFGWLGALEWQHL